MNKPRSRIQSSKLKPPEMTNLEYQDGGQSAFPIHKQTSLFGGNLRKVKTLVKSLFLRPQRTLDLEYQDGGDELQNLITEITAMRDPGLFISVIIDYK